MNTPKGTFHPRDLSAAMDSVRAGNGTEAVMKLVHPYRLDGPNPRPDVLNCVFKAMGLAIAKAEAEQADSSQ